MLSKKTKAGREEGAHSSLDSNYLYTPPRRKTPKHEKASKVKIRPMTEEEKKKYGVKG